MDLKYWPLAAAAFMLAACTGQTQHEAAEPPPAVTVLPLEPLPIF